MFVKKPSPFYVSIFGFAAGIACASFFHTSIYLSFAIFFFATPVLVFFWSNREQKYFSQAVIFLIVPLLIFLIAFSLGLLRFQYIDFVLQGQHMDALLEQSVSLRGVIDKEPSEGVNTLELVIRTEEASTTIFSGENRPKTILVSHKPVRVITYVPLYENFSYGDEVEVHGRLTNPQPIIDDSGRAFDYPSYLLLNSIVYQVLYPKVTVIAHSKGNPFIAFLLGIKKSFILHLNAILPEPENALMSGILLGEKRSLGTDIEDEFRQAGVIHVVILSGYTITLVAQAVTAFFETIFFFLSPRWAAGAGALGIIFFAMIAGGSATILRASIMALLVLTARFFRRDYDVRRALALSLFLIVFYEPRTLIFDSSFQISFISVFGLIHLSPILSRLRFIQMITERWKLREIVVSTLATQIFSLPFLIYQVGQVSLVGVFANLLILSLIPFTMLSGFLAGLASFVSHFVGVIFATVPYWLLRYILVIVGFFAHLSFASVDVVHFSFLAMLACYGCYGGIYFLLTKRQQ